MKKTLFAGALLSAATVGFVVNAAEIKNLDLDAKNWYGTGKIGNKVVAFGGGWGSVFGKEMVKINPAKTYEISGEFRAVKGAPLAYLGFKCFDKDKREIASFMVMPETAVKSVAVIAEAVKPGDKVVKLKNATGWKKINDWGVLAFNAKADLSDLPNKNCTDLITGVETKDGVTSVTLKAPMKVAIPAGTMVRMQRHGATFVYVGAVGAKITGDWKKFSGKIAGIGKTGNEAKFRPGTVYVQPMIMKGGGTAADVTEARNFKLIEL